MHLLKYNPDAKTLTEVPPSEFDADPTCRYFYVQGKRAHVPIVTPDGIGEIVWQHPDYQPPSPANDMTDHPIVGTYGWPIGTTDEQKRLGKTHVLRADLVIGNYRVRGSTSCGHTFAMSIGVWQRNVSKATAQDWSRTGGAATDV
jgi:hypothetical protein